MRFASNLGALVLASASVFSYGCTPANKHEDGQLMPVEQLPAATESEDEYKSGFLPWKMSDWKNSLKTPSLTYGINFDPITYKRMKIERPKNLQYRNLTFNGQGVGIAKTITTDLNIPSTIDVNVLDLEMGAYVGVRGEQWPGFKLGIKPIGDEFIVGKSAKTDKGKIGDDIIDYVDYGLPWGRWPLGGISIDITKRNLLFFELGLARLTNDLSENATDIHLVGRLDDYKTKWDKWTLRYPYGNEWYDDFDGMLISKERLSKEGSKTISLGLKLGGNVMEHISLSITLLKEFPLKHESDVDISSFFIGLNLEYQF